MHVTYQRDNKQPPPPVAKPVAANFFEGTAVTSPDACLLSSWIRRLFALIKGS